MANVIDDAVAEISTALAGVLPGRSTASPRTETVGPSLWVEMPTLTADRVPQTKQILADFPVWITADGPDRSQVAFLNDCVARAFDALDRVPHCYPVSSRPAPTEPGVPRAVILTVRKLLAGRGFCRPDPAGESPIPPDPIDPITPEPSEED